MHVISRPYAWIILHDFNHVKFIYILQSAKLGLQAANFIVSVTAIQIRHTVVLRILTFKHRIRAMARQAKATTRQIKIE
jgi:hypothetical protein